MTDLMKNLRSEAVNWSASCGKLFDEAADRIEALEAALIQIDPLVTGLARRIARDALAPEQDK